MAEIRPGCSYKTDCSYLLKISNVEFIVFIGLTHSVHPHSDKPDVFACLELTTRSVTIKKLTDSRNVGKLAAYFYIF